MGPNSRESLRERGEGKRDAALPTIFGANDKGKWQEGEKLN